MTYINTNDNKTKELLENRLELSIYIKTENLDKNEIEILTTQN
jgi:hypothetical protein